MIEHPIHNNAQPHLMCLCYKRFKVFVIAQSAINHPIILRIITMCRRLKQRSDIDRITSERLNMWKPFFQFIKTMYYFSFLILQRRTAHSKWIHMIKYC